MASILACGIAALAAAPPAGAVDLLDGRLHVNGSIEEQIRGLSRNFEENLDLAQWYTVLGVEIDAELLPDGWGPFSSMSAFSRLEVRYDCVWTRACGLARSADTFGDRARKVPPRLGEARIGGYAGAAFTGDRRRRMGIPIDLLGFQYKDTTDGNRNVGDTGLWNVPSVDTLFGVKGALQNDPVDDPALYTFRNFLDYRFALRHIDGVENGHGTQVMGPWLPKNGIDSVGTTADIVNPFNAAERNPITGIQGSTALPYRPPPRFAADSGVALTEARGLYYPSAGLRRLVADDVLDDPDQEFRQNQLAWNRGASQKDTAELKEIYLDVGFLEDRLFFRIGKQNIVWGKTELFRTTDQFNPQDLALATLPSLEESRIALWAFRAFYSFYEVGPLSDVRLEVATNFDHYEPNDLGRCGEPYAPNPVCDKTFGLFAHGLVGLGVSGEKRPDDPWKSVEGYEVGARLEFRWDRYSFAITDYWGFDDFPYIDKYWTFERNVDPTSGRPRKARATGPCVNGNEPACLGPNDALTEHHANLQYFALICSSSVGFSDLDRSVCAQSVFNSQADALGDTVAHRISTLLGGGFVLPGPINTANIILNGLSGTTGFPVVLNTDPADGPGTVLGGVSSRLTAQQEALLGCGPFYGQSATGCDDLGIDLLNAEASALIQSFVGFQGAGGVGWLTNDASVAQPGTIGFAGGPVCTRHMNGVTYVLPGCRGPGDAGYDPAIDGTNTGLTNLAGQPFRSEMAALSFNFQNLLVAFSSPAVPGQPQINEFDSTQPLRTNGCSYAAPQFCSNVQAIFAIVGSQRNSVLAGGNGTYGRTDFVWHGGSPNLLRYDKRNVLGFSMDFAEDTSATNWSVEATWIAQTRYADNDVARGYRDVDEYNLTISVDRPTFINFLNTGRTFFFNSQWFFQYVNGYRKSFPSNGPFNVLATFTIQTGYFQDRLLPGVTFVYDFESNSGAILPELQYRVTESLSLTIGMAGFWGRTQEKVFPFSPSGLDNHVGKSSYHAFAENGLAAVRDKDEIFFKFRWTF